jgi:hypothetical protein
MGESKMLGTLRDFAGRGHGQNDPSEQNQSLVRVSDIIGPTVRGVDAEGFKGSYAEEFEEVEWAHFGQPEDPKSWVGTVALILSRPALLNNRDGRVIGHSPAEWRAIRAFKAAYSGLERS